MEDVTTVQLVVCILSTDSTCRVDELKLGIDIYFYMVKCWVPGVYPVLHDLRKSIPRHSLYIFNHGIHRNMFGDPQ